MTKIPLLLTIKARLLCSLSKHGFGNL